MNWTIRRAGWADAEALALIGAASFLATFAEVHTGVEIAQHCRSEHSVVAYERLLQAPADAWLVETTATAAPVGYALLGDADLPGCRNGDLELKRIYLLPGYHGTGAGAELMQRVLERARERGAKRLLLGVYSGNARALAYYRKHAFQKIADHRFFVGETGYDDVVLALQLE